MADKRITELTEATNPSLNDVLPIVSEGSTKKVTLDTINNLPKVNLTVTNEVIINNPTNYSKIEMGGLSGGYIDIKSPYSNDYDLRLMSSKDSNYIQTATGQDFSIAAGQNFNILANNTGIGTTTPTARLDVFQNSNTEPALTLTQAGGGLAIRVNDVPSDTSPFVVTSIGHVGIGLPTPTAMLHLSSIESTLPAVRITNSGSGGDSFIIEDESLDPSPFVIKNDGKVGIGTAAPSEKLTVSGNISATGTIRSNNNLYSYRNQNDYNIVQLYNLSGVNVQLNAGGNVEGNLRTVTNHPLSFSTANTHRMIILSGGNVGIGTLTPNTALTINGDLSSTSQVYARGITITPSASSDQTADLTLVSPNNSLDTTWFFNNLATGDYNPLSRQGDKGIIFSSNTSQTEGNMIIGPWSSVGRGIVIDGINGRVGINKRPTLNTFDVNGTIGSSKLEVDQNSNTEPALTLTQAGGGLAIRVNDVPSDTSPFVVTSIGHVGIGLPAPTAMLHLSSIESTLPAVRITNSGSGGDSFVIEDESLDPSPFVIKNDGKVGIGTAAPSEKLTVSGNISATGTIISNNNLYSNRNQNDYNIVQLYNLSGVMVQLNANGDAEGNLRTVTNHPLSFSTANIQRMTILSGGNVGIGTTTPSERLHVVGNIFCTNEFAINHPTTYGRIKLGGLSGGYIDLKSPYSDDFDLRLISERDSNYITTGGNKSFYIAENYTPRMFILSGSGNVGFGTTTPSQKVQVAGNVLADSFISNNNYYLPTNGVAISSTRAGFFGTSITLLSGSKYELEYNLYFKSGVGTPAINYALSANNSSITYANANFMQDRGGAQAPSTGTVIGASGALLDLGTTETVTANSSLFANVKALVVTGSSPTTISLTLSCNDSIGVIPQQGSYRKVTLF